MWVEILDSGQKFYRVRHWLRVGRRHFISQASLENYSWESLFTLENLVSICCYSKGTAVPKALNFFYLLNSFSFLEIYYTVLMNWGSLKKLNWNFIIGVVESFRLYDSTKCLKEAWNKLPLENFRVGRGAYHLNYCKWRRRNLIKTITWKIAELHPQLS